MTYVVSINLCIDAAAAIILWHSEGLLVCMKGIESITFTNDRLVANFDLK